MVNDYGQYGPRNRRLVTEPDFDDRRAGHLAQLREERGEVEALLARARRAMAMRSPASSTSTALAPNSSFFPNDSIGLPAAATTARPICSPAAAPRPEGSPSTRTTGCGCSGGEP